MRLLVLLIRAIAFSFNVFCFILAIYCRYANRRKRTTLAQERTPAGIVIRDKEYRQSNDGIVIRDKECRRGNVGNDGITTSKAPFQEGETDSQTSPEGCRWKRAI